MKNFKQNPEFLLDVLSKPKNQNITKELITNILKIDFQEIKINPKIQKVDRYSMSDPNFYLIEMQGELESGITVEIGLRFIDPNKLKENSFMYWTYIFSKELNKYNEDEVFDGLMMTNRLNIYQENIEKHHDGMHIGIDNQEGDILHYGVEIHFVQIEKYISELEDLKAWKKYSSCFHKDFLLVGMKLEKEILQGEEQV